MTKSNNPLVLNDAESAYRDSLIKLMMPPIYEYVTQNLAGSLKAMETMGYKNVNDFFADSVCSITDSIIVRRRTFKGEVVHGCDHVFEAMPTDAGGSVRGRCRKCGFMP